MHLVVRGMQLAVHGIHWAVHTSHGVVHGKMLKAVILNGNVSEPVKNASRTRQEERQEERQVARPLHLFLLFETP
jgi:hypothetical protein